jgi:hypothetical protein
VFLRTHDLHALESIGGAVCVSWGDISSGPQGVKPVTSSMSHYARSVSDYARSRTAVQIAMMAAGVTISAIAVLQTVYILTGWFV